MVVGKKRMRQRSTEIKLRQFLKLEEASAHVFMARMGKLETTSGAFFWQPWVCRDMIQLLRF